MTTMNTQNDQISVWEKKKMDYEAFPAWSLSRSMACESLLAAVIVRDCRARCRIREVVNEEDEEIIEIQ